MSVTPWHIPVWCPEPGDPLTSRREVLVLLMDSASSFPVPHTALAVHVLSDGFDCQVNSVTDSSGVYSAVFFPAPNEAGLYALSATNPAVVTRAAQSTFTITGFGFPHNSPAPDVRPTNNSMNPGWNPGVNPSIVKTPGGGFQRTTSNGSQQVFVPLGALNQPVNGSGPEFAQPVDVYDQLTALNVAADGAPGAFQERTKDGDVTRYDLFGSTYYPTLLTDRNGNTLAYTRDASGNLQKLTDVHGRYLSFSYDAQGRMIQIADSAGRTVAYAYNSAGDRIGETDPDGDVTQYAYGANHRITQVTYPNGGHHAVNYDSQGRVASESDDGGNNAKAYSYYASSTAVTDALGRVTVYGWIQNSGLRKINRITDPNGGVATYAYDQNMNLVGQTDPLGRTTKFQYDASGNVTAATDANGQTTQTAYEPNFNQPTGVIDPKANKTAMSYDAKGNLTQTQDALGDLARMSYDAQGHVTASKDPLSNVTTFAYDNNGALSSVADPLGRAINMTRDALSRVTKNVDPAGKQTTFTYDAQSNLTQVTDALNGLTRYNYATGREGRLLNAVTDAKNQSTTFGYDATARLTTVKNALNQAKSFNYDPEGNLASITDAKGQTISFAYDHLDRLVTKTLPEGMVTDQYDPAGNLLQVSNYNGSVVAMTYDNLNRVTQVIQTLPGGFSATIGYSYDANGNKTGMTTPWGNFSYTYDSLNRLTSITNPQGEVFKFAYDALGRRTKLDYPNGIETTYAYDAASQLTQIMHRRLSDNAAVAFANYTYDAAGNRTGMQDLDGTHNYSYDALNRLTSAAHPPSTFLKTQSEVFSYDGVGNRLSDAVIAGYACDTANRLQSNSSFTYTYDANGNQTSKKDVTGNVTNFSFDSQNELTGATLPGGANWTYKYDGLGRRIEKSSGTLASQIARFIYDNDDILAMLDGSNNLIAVFTQGPGIDEPLIIRKTGGTEYFYHADALGSIVTHSDATGHIVERIEYETYGQTIFIDERGPPLILAQSLTGSPYGFAARPFDAETGFYFNEARYLDPSIGRFIAPDPIGFEGEDVNFYTYVSNQPLNWVDPDGTAPVLPNACPFPPMPKPAPQYHPNATADDLSDIPDSVDGIREEARRLEKLTRKDRCEILREWYQKAKRAGNFEKARKIQEAQKYEGCRNKRKQRSSG